MIILRMIVVLVCILFMALVFKQVSRGRLLLRYSLLWLSLAVITIVSSIFPEPLYSLAYLLGFDTPSNFVYFAALFFLLAISLSLSAVVSKQAVRMKGLIQRIALIEKELEQDREAARGKSSLGSDFIEVGKDTKSN